MMTFRVWLPAAWKASRATREFDTSEPRAATEFDTSEPRAATEFDTSERRAATEFDTPVGDMLAPGR